MNGNDTNQTQFCPYGQFMAPPPQQQTQSISPMTPIGPYTDPSTPLSPSIPSPYSAPITPSTQQGPPPVTESDYIPGFLASNIGRNVKAEFIVGTSQYVEKVGKLIRVGVNFFVLQDINSRTNIMCDLYSVRFVTILYA